MPSLAFDSSSQRSGAPGFRVSSQRNFVEGEEGMTPTSRSDRMDDEPEMDEKDVMRILITTDNHVGFLERDPVRRDDSFIIFEEIIGYAQKHNVDFVLQGGDLFHENKPSRETLHKAISILRRNVFGDKPVPLQILSDQAVNFRSNPEKTVNYEDPNVNIALPIFAISGNHDAWSGENSLSVLDILSQCNLVNYFGKCDTVDKIQVKPILIQKGDTKLALYGLGYIRDERLYQTFKNQQVTFYRPSGASNHDSEDSQKTDEWFNLFAIHQNHNQHHNKKGNISESMLKGFFDLVVWGHEHEQQIVPIRSATGGFEVMQPGSSISTTYTPQECKPKKVAILEIYKDTFRCIPITLKTVRPYIFDAISLSDYESDLKHIKNNPDEISDFLVEHVNQLIIQAKEDKLKTFEDDEEGKKELKAYYKKHPGLDLPIVRLKVDYSGGYASINPQRFGQNFVGKIANPSDLLIMTRKKTEKAEEEQEESSSKSSKKKKTKDQLLNAIINSDNTSENFIDAATDALTDGIRIEDLVSHYLQESSTKKSSLNGLLVLDELEFQNSVSEFVDKEEVHAIDDFVNTDIKNKQKKLWSDIKQLVTQSGSTDISEEDIEKFLRQYREESKAAKELNRDKSLGDRLLRRASRSGDADDVKSEEEEEEEEKPKKKATRGKKKVVNSDEEEEEEKPKKKAAATRGRKKKVVNSDEEEEEEKPKKKAAPKRKKKTSDDEEEEEPPKKKTTRGKKATTTTKKSKAKFKSLDDDEEEEEEEKPKKKTTRGRKKAVVEEEEEEEEKPKKRTTRGKKADTIIIDEED